MTGPVPELLVALGGRSWRFTSAETVLVGRGDGCDVAVDDPRVSQQHLRIRYRGGWFVQDLDSTNGSWLDGARFGRHRVVDRTAVRLACPSGGQLLELALDPPPRRAKGGDMVIIGRATDNDIVLDDVRVSRRHARLNRTARGWRVTDLGSRNGTLVNGTAATGPIVVSNGDRMTFGGTDLIVDGENFVPAGTVSTSLVATGAGYHLPDGRSLLSGVDLRVRPGEFLAVVGPSGAGKSTLVKLLTGQIRPDTGSVTYDDFDVHDEFPAVRDRVGLVPQDDLVHRGLTARQALNYSAILRLPPDTTRAERASIVDATLGELGMTEHANTRIDRLSGGQRKRVSVALELLTSPSLLVLDEPTSGLDPALDRQLMVSLRKLADAGRIVVVVTHNVANLGQCDTVLVLAPGGVPVYTGPPASFPEQFGTEDWTDVFAMISARPPAPAAGGEPVGPRPRPAAHPPVPRATLTRQVGVLCRRHARLILADRPYATFLAVLPVALAVLALVVPGEAGLRNAHPLEAVEASQILVLLFVGAAFMGGAAGAREVVGEREIALRERRSGVLPAAYSVGKACVFTVVCALQTVLLVGVLLALRPRPAAGLVVPNVAVELGIAVWGTATASCLLALLGSAMVRSTEQAMPVLVVTVMTQLVMCGGMVPVTGRVVLDQLSWLFPTRWGYAAGAATVNLTRPGTDLSTDGLWAHTPAAWWSAVAVLALSAVVFVVLLAMRMKRR